MFLRPRKYRCSTYNGSLVGPLRVGPLRRCRPTVELRRAFTLLELTVVMAVLGGIAVAAATMMNGRQVVSTVTSKQTAELLVATLRMARTTAILHGAPVQVVSDDTGFCIYDSAGQLLYPKHLYAPELQVSWSSSNLAFQPTGMTDHSLQISLVNDVKQWRIDVLSASGQVSLAESLQ